MNRRASSIIMLISLSFLAPQFAYSKQTTLERNIEAGQQSFEQENFVKAERFWKKAQLELEKSGTPDERLAKLCQQLGLNYFKQGKYPLAETFYKQSLEISKGLSLEQSEVLGKLKDLDCVYRPINILGFDETSSNFAKQVGAQSACGIIQKDQMHHIDINLEQKFQQKIKELAESFMPKAADGAAAKPEMDLKQPEGAPPVKSLRLEKKISFDLIPGADGSIKLSNIQGIFFDVGLWAKLKELTMTPSTQAEPEVEVTAGAFGVEKKVKSPLPKNVFDRLKDGITKFDPFGANNPIASASGSSSSSTSNSASSPAPTQTPATVSSPDTNGAEQEASTTAPTSSLPDSSNAPKVE